MVLQIIRLNFVGERPSAAVRITYIKHEALYRSGILLSEDYIRSVRKAKGYGMTPLTRHLQVRLMTSIRNFRKKVNVRLLPLL